MLLLLLLRVVEKVEGDSTTVGWTFLHSKSTTGVCCRFAVRHHSIIHPLFHPIHPFIH